MRRKGYLSARSARWISCLSEKERDRERERESYRKRKSINNYSVWVYFPTQKQIMKILIRITMIKNSVPGQPQVARTHPKRSASRKPPKHHRHSAWTGLMMMMNLNLNFMNLNFIVHCFFISWDRKNIKTAKKKAKCRK